MRKILLIGALASLALTGCSAGYHAKSVRGAQDGDRLTVGTVQREIHVGMSGAGVIEALGSPNVVTTDAQRREVWVYDKISTESVQSSSSGGIAALIFAPFAVAGAGGVSANQASGAQSTSQRTFTVIVKFDESKQVRDFAYHTTRF